MNCDITTSFVKWILAHKCDVEAPSTVNWRHFVSSSYRTLVKLKMFAYSYTLEFMMDKETHIRYEFLRRWVERIVLFVARIYRCWSVITSVQTCYKSSDFIQPHSTHLHRRTSCSLLYLISYTHLSVSPSHLIFLRGQKRLNLIRSLLWLRNVFPFPLLYKIRQELGSDEY